MVKTGLPDGCKMQAKLCVWEEEAAGAGPGDHS